MQYRVSVKRLSGGGYHARCNAGPDGVVEAEDQSAAAAVARVEKEIRYRLELCPCSRPAREVLKLEVVDLTPARPAGRS